MARVSLISPNNLNAERHAYCLCLHVRPATIFVAVMNLTGSLLCALLTFFFFVNNDHQPNSYFSARLVRDELNRINLVSVLMYLLLALVSAMLLYGVIKSKPRYILPFFGIQFIDYLFTLPQFFASVTHPYHYYVARSKTMMDIQDSNKADFDNMRNNVWSYSSNTTPLLILTLIMIFKTYFLCVVWKCYRYLHMKELILPITMTSGNFDRQNMMAPVIISRSNIPPPNYEEATKLPDYKPPEYTTVVNGGSGSGVVGSPNSPNENFQTIAIDSPQTESKTV